MSVFAELSIIIGIAAGISILMKVLRQPLVVGYILSGVLVGPFFLDLLRSVEALELFSKIGIAILLFIVGLSLNPIVIREVGKVSLLTGVGQVVFTSIIGFLIVRALGYGAVASTYIAIALTFSSTIIILKLLSDKGDLDKLYGKISVGFLLIQDLIATIILLAVSAFALPRMGASAIEVLSGLFIKGALLISILILISRFFLPRAERFFARSQELLFVFSLAWGFGVAAIFAEIGFSVEIGALIAGVALSLSPFSYEIGARMKPLRDFFIILFFILLGSQLAIGNISQLILPALILSGFVLVGNPIIVIILMNLLGYKRKIGFMAGLTVAQISEFSLILVAVAHSFGHISQEIVSLITLVGVITIAGSTYLILYADHIYPKVEWWVKLISFRKPTKRERTTNIGSHEAIIFGFDRVGIDFVNAVEKLDKSYVVVDFSPDAINKLQDRNIPFRYGDAEDVEFLEELGLQNTELIVSTIPDFNTNLLLIRTYRRVNSTGIILVISHDIDHARELYLAGASYVIMSHYLGAHHASLMITKYGFDSHEFERERNLHLQKLSKRGTR